MSVLQLLYVSRAVPPITRHDASAIAGASRTRNYRADITGCLLYTGRAFAQVLEGRPEDVERLVRRIAADPRHDSVRTLHERVGRLREHGTWSMGFVADASLDDLVQELLLGEVDADPDANADAVARLLGRMRPDTVLGEL